ncbi:hypothetical protein FZX15_15775 [Brucella suis bv. 1]|nr:hypothetical protein FZX15_15775 [Brucella suis bv. 1]
MPHYPTHRSGIGNQSRGLISPRRRFTLWLEKAPISGSLKFPVLAEKPYVRSGKKWGISSSPRPLTCVR